MNSSALVDIMVLTVNRDANVETMETVITLLEHAIVLLVCIAY